MSTVDIFKTTQQRTEPLRCECRWRCILTPPGEYEWTVHVLRQYGRPSVKLLWPLVIIMPHHSTTYVDAAYCYRPSSVICLSVTLVSPAKTAEPIEMPFMLRTRMGPGTMY